MSDEEKKPEFTLEKLKIKARVEETHDEVIELKAEIKQLRKELSAYAELAQQNDVAIRGNALEDGIHTRLKTVEEILKIGKQETSNWKWLFIIPVAVAIVIEAIRGIWDLFGKHIKWFWLLGHHGHLR